MLEVWFCSTCHDTLCSFGDIANVVFEELCGYYLQNGAMEVRAFDTKMAGINQILDFLEKKGYVVSTDTSEGIFVKPCGIEIDSDEECPLCTICIKRHLHENTFEE